MEKVLKLYTYLDGVNDSPFPSLDNQIEVYTFRCDYKRMGATPSITCTVMCHDCLDNLWTDNVYAEFNGEKFFLKQTPTSSYDNTDSRYKHELELVSERIILDNVYFYDVVDSDEPTDKPVSNSSKFTFWGTINEFAQRLNQSLEYSKVGYRVVVDNGISSEGKLISFENQFFSNALQEAYKTYEIPYYFVGKEIHIGFTDNAITHTFKYGVDESLLSIQKSNANAKIVNRITGVGSADNIPYYYPNNDEKGETRLLYNGEVGSVSINNVARFKKVKLGDVFSYKVDEGGTTPLWVLDEYNLSEPNYWGQEVDDSGDVIDGVYLYNVNFSYSFPIDIYKYVIFEVDTHPVGYPYDMELKGFNLQLKEDTRGLIGTYYKSFSENLGQGNYVLQVNAVMRLSYKPEEISLSDFKEIINIGFFINATYEKGTVKSWYLNGAKITLDSYGITTTNTPKDGDKITFEQVSYLMPQKNLMPTIYRESEGEERFYNALNETYISPQTNDYYQFENPYVDGKPKEHFINFEEIKPTIVGITNAGSQRIDMFSEFAYDENDSDEMDEEGNYIHPYFFGKLRRFDGEYGFNLFEHAIDEEEMTISMTSGNCGGCEWVIGVDEDTQKNIVQVNEYGNLLRDDNGNVKLGSPQERQNDTSKYEVWVALKKDINTFGVIMPNETSNYRPNAGDTFVILHIDLPKAYILAAEKKLEEELIKYMAINNSEKFNFSILFSRIFFAENPDILEQLNENARIQIEYDNTLYELYVSSYSYNMSNDTPLPEIKVELSDTLTVSQNAIQNAVDSVKHDIMSSVGSIDFLKQGLRYFIRKDVDDRAKGKVSTDKAFEVGEYVSGSSGAIIYKDPITGQTIGEMDKLYVRMKAYFETLEIINAQSIGGKQIINPVGSVSCVGVEELNDAYRCYFLAEQDGEVVQNRWKVNDQAYSQMFNANIGVTNKVYNHYYWRLVINVSGSLVEYNEKKCHYIDLSKTDMDKNSDIPKVGDIINQRGSRTDIDRMNFVETSSIDAFSPSVTLYHGVNSFSLVGKDYVQFGVDKSTNKAFMNVYGDMYVGDRNKTAYMRYTQEEGLVICGKLDVGTKLGDSYLKDLISASTPEGYQEFVEKVTQDLAGLQSQIDGTIDSYFFQYEPSLDNYPASEWDTENEKKAHLNDTFTNLVDGRSWRWSLDGTYKWIEITDTATTKALALAGKANDTADGKRRVFVVTDEHPTPYPPYDKGDLWSRGSDYPLMICVVQKESGVYAEGDFDYADNTERLREEMTNLVNTTKTELDSSISSTKKTMEGYTDDAKKALQQSIDLLEKTKAEVDNVYTKADADDKISAAEAKAINKAEELAEAAKELAETNVKAWADGEISDAEQRAIDEAQERVDAAKSELEKAIGAIDTKYSNLVTETKDELNNSIGQAKEEAVKNANSYTDEEKKALQASIDAMEKAKANIVEVYSKSEADGKISESEERALKAAEDEADAAITYYDTIVKAYADGVATEEELAVIAGAKAAFDAAKKYAEEQAQAAREEIENSYLFQALTESPSTEIENGLVLTSLIQLRNTDSNIMSGINGLINASKGDKSIATWWGGEMLDIIDYYRWDGTQWVVKSGVTAPSNLPSGLIRMDGTGYLAKGKFWWDNNGKIYADPTALFLMFDVEDESASLSQTILNLRDKQTEFTDMWELRTDGSGNKYLYSKRPLVTQGGVTMYANGGDINIPSIYDGLPIDGTTIYWENGILKAKGGGGIAESVSWADITGKPEWLLDGKISYSEIEGTPDLSVYALKRSLSEYVTKTELTNLDYADKDWVKEYVVDINTGNITAITKQMVIEALGYTPYNSTNPAGYITSTALNGYATQDWVTKRGYLTSIPSEYITETELAAKGYATALSVNTALGNKVDKIDGKGLSTEDFTTALKTKLESLNNYNDTAISNAVTKLRNDFDALVEGDTSTAIDNFNEIIAFLNGVQDNQDLSSIIASIEQQIASRYTKPSGGIPKSDLVQAVQTSLGKADSALQSHQSIYTLTFQSGTFASGSFTANSGNKTINIPTTTSHISEGGNLYFTNARAVSALADTLKSYVTLSGTQTISGEKNFTGGLKVNGSPIVYDAAKKYWKLEGDLLVTGGLTMYGSDSSFTPSTIMDAIAVDGTTISKEGGVLKVIGGGGAITSITKQMVVNALGFTPISSSDIPKTLPNPYVLKFGSKMYDGSASKTILASDLGITWDDILGRPTLLSSFTDDVVAGKYLPLSGGTLSGHLILDHNSRIKMNGLIEFYKADGSFGAFLGTITDANNLTIYDGRLWSEILHTGNYSSYALPLSGGTMSSNAYIAWNTGTEGNDVNDWNTIDGNGLRIISSISSTSNAPIAYSTALHVKGRYGFQLASRGGANDNFYIRNIGTSDARGWMELLHSGNYSSYALPLSGGTITGTTHTPLAINTTATSDVGLRFDMSGEFKGWVGYSPNMGVYLYSYSTSSGAHQLGLTDAGVGFLDSYTLIHSGNIGSQIVEGITTHVGDATNANGDIAKLNSYYSSKGFRISRFNGLNGLGTKNSDGLIVNWPLDHSYGQQWYIDDESHTIQTRYVSGGAWSDWKTIAFTDSNVASATKLQTARTIWGQSFDGTGNVSGHLSLPKYASIKVTDYNEKELAVLELNGEGNLLIGQYTTKEGYDTVIYGNTIKLAYGNYGTSTYSALVVNPQGNVTIGAGDLASTNYRLYVNGKSIYRHAILADRYNGQGNIAGASIVINKSGDYFGIGPSDSNKEFLSFGTTSNYSGDWKSEFMTIARGGNVLIGTTTNSGYKLDVNGTLNATTIYQNGVTLNSLLDAKLNSSRYTASDVLAKLKTVDGSGSGLDADMLDGYNETSFLIAVTKETSNINSTFGYTTNRPFIARLSDSSQTNYPNPTGDSGYGNLVHFGVPTKDTAFQLYSAYSTYRLLYRMGTWYSDGSGSIHNKAWKEVAFTDSNVASATKLQTPRTIWGQSFDGTGDVSGSLVLSRTNPIVVTDTESNTLTAFQLNNDNSLLIGQDIAKKGYETIIYGNQISFAYGNRGSVSNTALYISPSGNVGIGTTNPSAKLDVHGQIAINGLPTVYSNGVSTFYAGNIAVTSYFGGNNVHLLYGASETTGLILNSEGNVGIGTTSPSAKLEVNGNVAFGGVATFNDVISINRNGSSGAILNTSKSALKIECYSTYTSFNTYTGGGASTPNVFVLRDNGNIGIGTTSPSQKLHVDGNILTTGGVTMYSMRKLKNIVDERGLSLEELRTIKPTRYTWKDDRDNRIHFGGIADDIQQVLPEVVYNANGVLTMDYGNAGFAIASSLIKPVVDHEQRIKALEKENEELKQEIKRLRA